MALVTMLLAVPYNNRAHARPQACNGYPELCSKPYNRVTYATAHNAYALYSMNPIISNQDNDIPTQLKDGIRAFMLDAYKAASPTEIQLCHRSCLLLDAGLLSKTLGQFKTFLDANPNEVITILWENSEKLDPLLFQTVYEAAGLSNYLHVQQPGDTNWPTLAEMIRSGKRIVNFLDGGYSSSVPWLMDEYSFVFETPWYIRKGEEYPCTIDRPQGGAQQSMYVMNHFIYGDLGTIKDVPQRDAADQTNGPDLELHTNNCVSTFKQTPAFVAVDFYDKGSLLKTVAKLNGVALTDEDPTLPASAFKRPLQVHIPQYFQVI
ncbi:hypothetical protein BGZ73_000650 [Actinomortierella ambigua]|nr:hypothetical protein BGZ73_000650 [Actinomortierella ambigua]